MKKEFYKKHDAKYLALGFTKKGLENDPEFYYKYDIVSEEERMKLGLSEDQTPCLLVGNTGINAGICLYTVGSFVWLAVSTPEEAILWGKKIHAFEEN